MLLFSVFLKNTLKQMHRCREHVRDLDMPAAPVADMTFQRLSKNIDQFIIPQYGSGRLCRGNDGDSHEISPIPLSAMLTKLFICKVDLDFSFSKFTLILSTDFLG